MTGSELPPPFAMTRCPHGRIICAACAATLDEPAGQPRADAGTLARLDTLEATMLAVIGQLADLRRLLGVE